MSKDEVIMTRMGVSLEGNISITEKIEYRIALL